jgi:hypothetical protein
VTDAIRLIIDEMRVGTAITDAGRWLALADALDDAGFDREARIARTQAAGAAGCEAALEKIEWNLRPRP